MSKNYEITELEHPKYPWLHRIRAKKALRDDVYPGTLGGYVQSEDNLSQDSECWLYEDAIVCEGAYVSGMAMVAGKAVVRHHAFIGGEAEICGQAVVDDYALITHGIVEEHAHISGNAQVGLSRVSKAAPHIYGHASVYGLVFGNVEIGESATILPGAKIDNPTQDEICILSNKIIAVRSVDRATAELEPPADAPSLQPVEKKTRSRKEQVR